VPNLERFEGIGVHYAATELEAQMCVGDPVAVIGGGNSAGQATLFLARHAARVRLVIRATDLTKDMSRYLADRIQRVANVDVLLHNEVRDLRGESTLEAIVVEDDQTGERRWIETKVLFVFIGAEPHVDWVGDHVALDPKGFVLTGSDAAHVIAGDETERALLPLETTSPGVFAAGDVRSGSTKRVASSVGEGAMAVRLIHEYLAATGERLRA
jgi:thioredoxin reductase (NADPH)